MQAIINPSILVGNIKVPASKSFTQRAYAGALLHRGKTQIYDFGHSKDDLTALKIIQKLGASIINYTTKSMEITSNGITSNNTIINCNESGLSARLFTPICTLSSHLIKIEGRGGLLQRPMGAFTEILSALNVSIINFNGYLPITLQGPLESRSITIDGSLSSQFLTGLLFALCYSANIPVEIKVLNLKSRPYIDMTLEVLERFGKHITHDNYEIFYIKPASFTTIDNVVMQIEADWSSAAYWLVAGALNGELVLTGLEVNSKQADIRILNALSQAGAKVKVTNSSISISASNLNPFVFDATDCPDLFPVLSILATGCNGMSYINGLHRLIHKESNRAETICKMLQQFKVPFYINNDTLCITGISRLSNTTINGYNDHRIIMSAAVGALRANGLVTINNANAINKSYPDFFKHLISLRGNCTLKND